MRLSVTSSSREANILFGAEAQGHTQTVALSTNGVFTSEEETLFFSFGLPIFAHFLTNSQQNFGQTLPRARLIMGPLLQDILWITSLRFHCKIT